MVQMANFGLTVNDPLPTIVTSVCRSAALLLLLVSIGSPLHGQIGGGEWQAFTSMQEINEVLVDDAGDIWAATDGGILHYLLATRVYRRFTRRCQSRRTRAGTCGSAATARD